MICWEGLLVEKINDLEQRFNILQAFSCHLLKHWIPHWKNFNSFSRSHDDGDCKVVTFKLKEVILLDDEISEELKVLVDALDVP